MTERREGEDRHQNNLFDRLHERLDEQNKMLAELDKKLSAHLIAEEQLAPAINELAALWRGSKLIIPIVAGVGMTIGAVIAAFSWVKDHIK